MKNIENITKERKDAKSKIFNLKVDIIKIRLSTNTSLTNEEILRYESWNNVSEKVPFLMSYKSERSLLIRNKQKEVKIQKKYLNSLLCEEEGHNESVTSRVNYRAYIECTRCNTHYNRPFNSKEIKSFEDVRFI